MPDLWSFPLHPVKPRSRPWDGLRNLGLGAWVKVTSVCKREKGETERFELATVLAFPSKIKYLPILLLSKKSETECNPQLHFPYPLDSLDEPSAFGPQEEGVWIDKPFSPLAPDGTEFLWSATTYWTSCLCHSNSNTHPISYLQDKIFPLQLIALSSAYENLIWYFFWCDRVRVLTHTHCPFKQTSVSRRLAILW